MNLRKNLDTTFESPKGTAFMLKPAPTMTAARPVPLSFHKDSEIFFANCSIRAIALFSITVTFTVHF